MAGVERFELPTRTVVEVAESAALKFIEYHYSRFLQQYSLTDYRFCRLIL